MDRSLHWGKLQSGSPLVESLIPLNSHIYTHVVPRHMMFGVPFCGLVGNTVVLEHRGRGFKPRYRQIHTGSDDHLKWQPSVIGPYPQWQAKEPRGH